ncbi:MAG: hypothetical protein MZW92_64395 [Comamonadaceae bacterium]|nr:hypothetical protein [Comamonadaceae bacterium]
MRDMIFTPAQLVSLHLAGHDAGARATSSPAAPRSACGSMKPGSDGRGRRSTASARCPTTYEAPGGGEP